MKARTILVAITVLVLLAAVGLWLRPFYSSQTESAPAAAERSAAIQTASSEDISAQRDALVAKVSPTRHHFSEEISAGLLAQIQQALASTNLEDREFALTNLLVSLVQENPIIAARFAETNSIADSRGDVLRRVAQLWAAQDSGSALAWAATLTNPGERDSALTDVCLQVAEKSPAEAVRMREQFVSGDKPSPALEILAQRWAEQDFPGALSWTLARDRNEQRDQLVARLAFIQAHFDPLNAATLAVEKIPAGDAQNEAVMSVLHQWALNDISAAAAWVEAFPPGPLRDRAANELINIDRYHQASAVPAASGK